jgi:hypothetical protein
LPISTVKHNTGKQRGTPNEIREEVKIMEGIGRTETGCIHNSRVNMTVERMARIMPAWLAWKIVMLWEETATCRLDGVPGPCLLSSVEEGRVNSRKEQARRERKMKREEPKKEETIRKVLWGRAVIVAMLLSLTIVTMSEAVYTCTPLEERYYGKCLLKQEMVHIRQRTGSLNRGIIQRGVLSYGGYLAEHTILLKGLIPRATYDIKLSFRDRAGNKVTEELTGVVPANILNSRTDDRRPPEISEVKVGPIAKGIFLETTITWATDEPATSYVQYGLSDLYGQSSRHDDALLKHHRVTIHGLERGRDYHFRVKCQDVFGNETVAEDLVFNTGKISPTTDIEEKSGDEDDRELGLRKAEIFVLDSYVGLYLQVTEPAVVSVEYLKVKEPLPTIESQLQAGVTNSCVSCHKR